MFDKIRGIFGNFSILKSKSNPLIIDEKHEFSNIKYDANNTNTYKINSNGAYVALQV